MLGDVVLLFAVVIDIFTGYLMVEYSAVLILLILGNALVTYGIISGETDVDQMGS